ncbi:hypothetical protein MMC07_003791 [Pseudocyphellaria aurata]|nr:hypothetical protein [Pseudocyphellaria aurata]
MALPTTLTDPYAPVDAIKDFLRSLNKFPGSPHRDWAKEQRDEAIRRANEKVDEDRAEALAIDTTFAQASSFTSEVTLDETFTIEALTEGSRTSRTEKSNTNTQKSEASSGEPSEDYTASVKRSSDLLKSSPRPQRKRRNAGDQQHPTAIFFARSANLTPRSPLLPAQLQVSPKNEGMRDIDVGI